ncbi:amidohydrolase family protein [Stenotrophomonas panacihumi]|uniref:amidohydrolase family protein n=1 Tax=Stenotrophomonas panacihumi TaxID=676599 RepID=UPI0009D738C3|nr:amidohydrolase family protein [Stenotrophomonas panacihumi]PTN55486.1 amidohydrolase [Stenotrophomonas panacihumi]
MRQPTDFRPAVLAAGLCAALACTALAAAPPAPATAATQPKAGGATYAMADFARVRKYDAHVHYNVADPAFLEIAREDGFELMTINVDYPDFPPLAKQREVALMEHAADPARIHWAATFSMHGFGQPGWEKQVESGLRDDVGRGATAVKIWKNVGMVEKDAQGHLVMLDNPALSPVAEYVRGLDVALIGHQGEPHNCWLPLSQMTTENDREYFGHHPQYHMYLHPDQPSYDDQMAARDRFVAAHPKLRFVGAHMASLEYDVDRLAAFLDRFPNASVDLAARMGQVQYQSVRDYAKVRDFFIRYQDRLMYGTDLTYEPGGDAAEFKRSADAVWRSDWQYLATGETQHVDTVKADVPGLALPRAVIDKIYYANAVREFTAPRR